MRSLAVAAWVGLIVSSAAHASPYGDWQRGLAARCPSHHVDWICGDCELEIVEAFDQTLTPPQRRRVAQAAALRRRCADEMAGFSCELAGSIRAYEKLGLMPRFVAFGCRTVKCEERAICSRFPRPPPGRVIPSLARAPGPPGTP